MSVARCMLVALSGLLACGQVLAQPTLAITGAATVVGPVAPPAGSPIDDIARDCGNSVRLSSCSSFWAFCDSYQFDSTAWFFLSNTAALAEPEAPTVMNEPISAAPRPFELISGAECSIPCDPGLRRVLWPWGAAAIPLADGRDRVVIYFSHSCSDDAGTRVGHGVGVAEWIHDPAQPPSATSPIRATILAEQLWPPGAEAHGWSPVHHAGHVLSYRCPDGQACRLARAPVDSVADLSRHEYFDGTGWSPDPAAAAPLVMPGTKPDAGPGVTHVPELGAWLMVYPLPWSFSRFLLRVAAEPWGPWSEPQQVSVPGCTRCYAARPHASLSGRGVAGFTVYDPNLSAEHGGLKAVQVPVSVTPDTPGVDLVEPRTEGFTLLSAAGPVTWRLRRGTIPRPGGLASRAVPLDDVAIAESASPALGDPDLPGERVAFYYVSEGLDRCGRVVTSR